MNDIEKGFLLQKANLPKRNAIVQTANLKFDGKWGQYLKAIQSKAGSGLFVGLCGTRGCGKTQLATQLVRSYCANGKKAYYMRAFEFFAAVKATYKKDVTDNEMDVIKRFARYDFLAIDEFGQRSETDWENKCLYELSDSRYADMKDTLIISNQTVGQFQESIGDSLVSRMNGSGGLIQCDWESYR